MRRGCQTTQAELSRHAGLRAARPVRRYGSSQHTLMITWPTRVILVVSYISPYSSWVPPTVSHLLPNYPPIQNEIQ